MKIVFSLLFATLLVFNVSAQENTWLHNLEEAQSIANENDQFILLNFSGSDWCANCMRLEKDLFSSEKFQGFADENLVLLNLDFPAKKANKLSKEQTVYNDALAEKYNKKGIFPLTLVLNGDGEIVGEMTYPCSNVTAYISNIKNLIK